MKVLVTGGAGYIGTELVKTLSHNPLIEEIIIYDNLARKNFNLFITSDVIQNKITMVDADLLDSRTLRKYVNQVNVVYHLAAKVTTPYADQDPHLFEQTNHWGTAELVYAIEDSNVEKLIYISSASVYGSGDDSFEENDTLNPRTFYAISKMRSEKHVDRLAKKVDCYTYRLGNVYGYSPSVRFDSVINKFLLNAHMCNSIDIHGDGTQSRAFIHITKVVDVLANTISGALEPGTYNLVDKNITISELVNELKQLYPEIETKYINQHLTLRSQKIKPSQNILDLNWIKESELIDDLKEFQSKFAFTPTNVTVS